MEYAIYLDAKTYASPGLKGKCPHCFTEVISKCGSKKIWHWAHKSNRSCDSWFEPETQWHRNWKDQFGKEFSEIRIQKGNDYHIADVLNHQNIVFEFQNSAISAETIQEREAFYGERMIWIVNGVSFKEQFHCVDTDFKKHWNLSAVHEFEMASNYSGIQAQVLIEAWKVNNKQVQSLLKDRAFFYLPELDVYARQLTTGVTKETVMNDLCCELLEVYEKQKPENDFIKGEFIWEHARTSWEVSKRPVFIDFGDDFLYHITSTPGRKYGEGRKVRKKQFLHKYVLKP